jgi:hypothetical protein
MLDHCERPVISNHPISLAVHAPYAKRAVCVLVENKEFTYSSLPQDSSLLYARSSQGLSCFDHLVCITVDGS